MPVTNAKGLIANRVKAIRAYHASEGMPLAEVDLSGGLDSAVVAALCVRALGSENVTCVYSSINSSMASRIRALEVAKHLGLELVDLPLSAMFASLVNTIETQLAMALAEGKNLPSDPDAPERRATPFEEAYEDLQRRKESDPTVLGSFRSCIRAPIGRYVNRLMGRGLRHGTGNECEDRIVRFYQKGGDGEVDLNVIEMLSKGEVYQLANGLGIPRSVRAAKPSPDLWGPVPHHDEDELSSWVGITPPAGMGWYSTVDPDTGEYTSVGLLERVARVDDLLVDTGICEDILPTEIFLDTPWYPIRQKRLLWAAHNSEAFPNTEFTGEAVMTIIEALQRVERKTRHKENPNIPTLGTRRRLRDAGILTDDLPL